MSPAWIVWPFCCSNSGAVPAAAGIRNPAAPLYTARMMRNPARKFIKDPAAKITSFLKKPWRFKDRASSEVSSSPSMAQKPPMGSSRKEYWVSPVSLCQIRGPMPMENSLTRTPQSFAAAKWPNSWTAIRTPKIRMAARIYTMVMEKLPSCYGLRLTPGPAPPAGPPGPPPGCPPATGPVGRPPPPGPPPPGGECRKSRSSPPGRGPPPPRWRR